MKFEQVLQIYWSKGFLYNGKILPFNLTLKSLIHNLAGLGPHFITLLIKRFELNTIKRDSTTDLLFYSPELLRAMNVLFSQISSVNNTLPEVERFDLIRLYLTKSYRGKAQAIGKPSHGQRTWSNAWTAYNYNRTIRSFVSTIQKTLNKNKVEEKINYKLIKRKVRKSAKAGLLKIKKAKTNVWF